MNDFSEYSDRSLTSEHYGNLIEALDTLYIKGNISGRNHFTLEWPDVAAFVFGDELLRCDREGTKDRKRRAELEEEAEEKRLFMVETLATLEARSVDKGSLQLEYVRGLINDMGRKLSLCVYAGWLVDRFIPPAPGEVAVVEKTVEEVVEVKKKDIGAPRPWETATHSDAMDTIKPISLDERDFHKKPEAAAPAATIIIETQQSKAIEMPSVPNKDSIAPVVGGEKKGGLKIMSISENNPEKPEGDTNS